MSKGRRFGINGFGRIGRLVFRQFMEMNAGEVACINDIGELDNLAYLLKYDSIHTHPTATIGAKDGFLCWGDRKVRFTQVPDPSGVPWKREGVEIVIEATPLFNKREDAARHLAAGAGRVIVTTNARGADVTICMGVNEEAFDAGKHFVVSNSSCTTNCLAQVAKVLDESFGIRWGFFTTVHAVTSTQSLVDTHARRWRRGRAAAVSIVPSTTGATTGVTLVIPNLKGKIDGVAMRVPVLDGSIIDLVVHTERSATIEAVNEAFTQAAGSQRLRGILGITEEELVSADIVGTPYSALVDAPSTRVLDGHFVKVLAWYDNEWGYARRVVDLAMYMSDRT